MSASPPERRCSRRCPWIRPGEGRHIVLAATHDIELVQMLADTYEPYHFEETVHPDGLTFDYQIRPGQAQTRNAIALLEASGAPAEVVSRARRRVAELDSRH
jgi:DNA mismatch repair ATPase MutS